MKELKIYTVKYLTFFVFIFMSANKYKLMIFKIFFYLILFLLSVEVSLAQDIYSKPLAEYQQMPKSKFRDSVIVYHLFSLSKLRQPGKNWDLKLKSFAEENNSEVGNYLWKLKYIEKEITDLNYAKGVDSLIKIGTALENLNQKRYASFAYLRIGLIYVYSTDNFLDRKNAFPYYQKAIKLATESKDFTEMARANDYMGELFYEMGDWKNAAVYLNKAQDYIEQTGDKYMYPSIEISLSATYFQMGKIELSNQCLDKANYWLNKSDLKFDSLYKAYINYIYQKGVASFYLNNNDYDKAIFHASQGLGVINNARKPMKGRVGKFDNYTNQLLKILYLSYSYKKDYTKAFNYLQEFHEKQSQIQKSELNSIFQDLNLKYQTEQKQLKINRLEMENTRNDLRNQQNFKYLLIGLLLALMIGLGYFIWLNRKLKQKNAEISAAMLQGQTIERKRVAADLHDNLGSTLSSIKWSLEAIDKSKMDKSELEVHQNLSALLQSAYNEVRLLSHNLLPEEFEKQGLASALAYFVRRINQQKKIKFSLDIAENVGRLDKKVEFELYSICLELANNIIKHSKATEAKISLFKITLPSGAGGLQLVVSDNGQGFFENNSDGKGMKNVQARVDSIGGKWNLQNTHNQGVKSEITIFV